MIICDVCGEEVEGWYKILSLKYFYEKAPPMASPFREVIKSVGGLSFSSGDLHFPSYQEIGKEFFVDDANICEKCQEGVNIILDELKELFHCLQGSAKDV